MIRQMMKRGLGLGLELGKIAAKEALTTVKSALESRRGSGDGSRGESPYASADARASMRPPAPPPPSARAGIHDADAHDHRHEHGHSHGHDHGHDHGHSHGHSHGQPQGGTAAPARTVVAEVQLGKKPGSAPREGLPRRVGDVETYIQQAIAQNPVLLFVKGTPSAPACGFSARVMDMFNRTGVPYQTVNVVEDPEIREGIKAFTQWPTIPQIFIQGEFVGGCDIVTEMFQNGEMQQKLATIGKTPAA